MSTRLPYFKFTIGEYMNGSIIYESYEIQGMFIKVCAMYWGKDCQMTRDELSKRMDSFAIQKLEKLNVIKFTEKRIKIHFLDEQYAELSNLHNVRVQAGRKGGLSKAKAKPKQNPSIKIREDKIIEDKKNKRFIPPTLLEVQEYFKLKGYYNHIALKAFEFYDAGGWIDGKGNAVQRWKQKMVSVWFKDEHKDPKLITKKEYIDNIRKKPKDHRTSKELQDLYFYDNPNVKIE